MIDQEDSGVNVGFGVLLGVVAFVVALVIGVAIYQMNRINSGYTDIEPDGDPILSIYFGADSLDFPVSPFNILASVIAALDSQPESIVVVSGFLDESGDARAGRQRCEAIRQLMLQQGVAPERVLVRKPIPSPQSISHDEGRRVEVYVQ